MARFYTLRKSRKILRSHYALFRRKQKKLSTAASAEIESDLRALDTALLAKDREGASLAAKRVQKHSKEDLRKTAWDVTRDLFFAILFAVVVAFIIRQFWFELYQVPTGSMRPTIQEQDRLLVSKTTFGINPPFYNRLFLFEQDYIQRGGIIVLTTQDMDLEDSNMLYFGFIPGKKRFVKRCVAKPGDTIYFYGGQIYGIDSQGEPFVGPVIDKIEHIPYITFGGKTVLKNRLSNGAYGEVTNKQMNLPLAKMRLRPDGTVNGSFFNGHEWVQENLQALKGPHSEPASYSDMWGIGNYAICRLLTPAEAERFYGTKEKALLFLELRHTPNMSNPKPQIRQGESGKYYPQFTPFATLIPLEQRHLDKIQDALITARFVVRNQGAFRYSAGTTRPQRPEFDPRFPGVKNGTYQFYYGQGQKVFPTGIQWSLPSTNPLYSHAAENVQKLFNMGFSFNTLMAPHAKEQPFMPARYAYWKEGDLIIMGAPILTKEDPTLLNFIASEKKKQVESPQSAPYIAFVDAGPPLKNGEVDADFIRAFGLKVPNDAVVALGDNYAGSADSRDFGFVPMHNLRGAPSFIFWPPGKRLGPLEQPPYPWFTFPNILAWTAALIAFVISYLCIKRRNSRSIFK